MRETNFFFVSLEFVCDFFKSEQFKCMINRS